MSNETWQMIAAAIVALTQVYATRTDAGMLTARFWDFVARVCGQIANFLGWMSLRARANYFAAVTYGT
jgi:hypothetical protein